MTASERALPIDESEVRLPFTDGSALPGVLAVPQGAGPWPGVLVIHEALGLNAEMRRIGRRFAGAGYATLAPNFLAGLGPMPFCLARFFRALGRGAAGRPFQQLDAARTWLAAQPPVDGARIGVAGFCVGGGFAMLWAAHAGPAVRVAAPFYGPVPADANRALDGICPTVASYGGRDRLFREMPERLATALTALGVEHDVAVYPDAGHSFMNELGGPIGWLGRRLPMHAGLHEPSAEDAWRRTLAFFDRHLAVAAPS